MSDVPVKHAIEVLERGPSRINGNHTSCVLGQELRFDRGALERCSNSRLDDLDVDLLVVLASVGFADRRVCRRRGSHWGRELALAIPVYLPMAWNTARPLFESLLHDATGDTWRLEFRTRKQDDQLRQLFLPRLSHEFRDATVVPYSGGLDSFATLARHRLDHGDTPLLLVHARNGARALHSVLPERDRSAPVLAVPFIVSGGPHAESSYRTRTLIFFSLAALAWRRTNAGRIWIGESGLGCLGPSLIPFGSEHPLRGPHPVFVSALQELFFRLWGVRPPFAFPHLWLTKGAALAELVSRDGLAGWQRTRSCSRNTRRQHPSTTATQCGVCAGCMFRRQSLLAAGLEEEPGTYFADVSRDANLPPDISRADHEVGTYTVIGLDELASKATSVAEESGRLAEIARALGRPREEIAWRVARLLRQHADEWRALVDTLPEGSWIRELVLAQKGNG